MSMRRTAEIYGQSLQAAMDSSLEALTPDARSLFLSFGRWPSSADIPLVQIAM